MLDENIWMQLTEKEKMLELNSYLNTIAEIDENRHELSNTQFAGKLAKLKKDLQAKVYQIIEWENVI
jgi:hypothetical protein